MAVPSSIRSIVAAHTTEPVYTSIPGDTGYLIEAAVDAVADAIAKADAFAIGPGLGQEPDTVRFVHQLLARLGECEVPGVLDADGLNAVAKASDWWTRAPRNLVLTPHPGEMARLLDSSVAEVQRNRFAMVAGSAEQWGRTVLLKGAYTLIGHATTPISINPTGGPNLATAGSGDVLTGTIAGLLAQGLSPRDAAIAGAWLHGAAGDRLRSCLGDAGTVASDLPPVLPAVRNKLAGR
jgi:NAD(P)H-hydrate epimerase